MTSSVHVERVAEAIWLADFVRELANPEVTIGWADLHPTTHVLYQKRAHAAIEALGLEEQWGAFYDDGTLHEDIADDRQHAEELAAERCQSCDHCRGAEPKHVESRLVSPWLRDGSE